MEGGWLDASEVAALLQISVTAVHRLCNRGSLSFVWLSGKRIFRRELVEKYSVSARRLKMTRSTKRKEMNWYA